MTKEIKNGGRHFINPRDITSFLVGGCVSLFIFGIADNISDARRKDIIPKKEVEHGYANPSKIEIKAEDRDSIKGNELYFNYDKKSYLLKEDEQGKPYI